MSKRYPGNFVTGNPVALSQTSNNGIWDVKDVSTAVGNNTWQEPDGYYEIPKSLRFKWVSNSSGASSYLKRTPPVAGNRRTWTFSGWVKRVKLDTGYIQGIFEANDPSNTQIVAGIRFETDNTIKILDYTSGYTTQLVTTQVFRDTSAWYHFVLAYDTTQLNAQDRVRLYVNGQQVSDFSTATYPSQNSQGYVNTAGGHYIGCAIFSNPIEFLDGYMAEVNFIDGKALDPSYFGYFDGISGIWQPKAYTGLYGQNGFYLPFNDTTSTQTLGWDRGNTKSFGTRVSTAQYSTSQSKFGGSSLLLNGSSDYLTVGGISDTASGGIFSMSSTGFTVEFWIYFNSTAEQTLLENFTGGGGPGWTIYKSTSGELHMYLNDGTTITDFASSASLLTTGQWYHIALTRNGSTIKGFINGTQVISGTYSGGELYQSSYPLQIGHRNPGDGRNFYTSGYINDLRITKGVSRYNSAFTAPTTANPVDASDPYWDNVVLAMPFNGVSGSFVFQNYSKYANNFQTFNISLTSGITYDSMVDSPTNIFTGATDVGGVVSGNYCILNALTQQSVSVTNAGLTGTTTGSAWYGVQSTHVLPTSGKWYWEVNLTSGGTNVFIGMSLSSQRTDQNALHDSSNAFCFRMSDSDPRPSGTAVTTGTKAGYAAGDVVGFAVDCDNRVVQAYKNGVLNMTWTAPTFDPTLGHTPTFFGNGNGQTCVHNFNFGQRPFAYTPPSGYKSLNTTNIQALGTTSVGVAAAQANKWFDAKTYVGDGTVANKVGGFNFQPDFVWAKNRQDGNLGHELYDSVRGPNDTLYIASSAGDYNARTVTAFNPDGFTAAYQSGDVSLNVTGQRHIAWCWKQSPTAGFNIVPYTGNGTTLTVSHNLGVTPAFALYKARQNTNWLVYHKSLNGGVNTQNYYMSLNTTAAVPASLTNVFAPTSSNFSVTEYGAGNTSGVSHIAYLWAEVPGFSKMGSYVGNGSADGTFINCGFKPKFVLIKATGDVESWVLLDSARNIYNIVNNSLLPNGNYAENLVSSNRVQCDFVSNGFKAKGYNDGNASIVNNSGSTYIYVAFAENPFALNNRAR